MDILAQGRDGLMASGMHSYVPIHVNMDRECIARQQYMDRKCIARQQYMDRKCNARQQYMDRKCIARRCGKYTCLSSMT